MRKRKIFSFIAFVIMFTLCVGQLHPLKTKAAPIDEKVLTISSPVESKFDSPGQIHWYKVVPGEKEIADFTHFRIKLQTEQELNISVYSSLENAMNNITFDRYMRYSYANSPALIDFPIAWTGSYYVKVEYNGEEGTIEETENPANEASAEDVPYTISYDGVSLPPSDQTISEECPAELSTKERENGKSILKDLRAIRDTVLSKTEDGKNLSSLYYKVAPYISAKLIFSKDTRDQVYKGLVQLKNLAADVAKNGNASTYTITKEDQEAINNLYSISRDSVPDSLKEQIDHMASKVGLSNLTNRTVSSVLTEAGLAEPEANTNLENRYIVKLKDGKKRSSFQSKAKSFGVNSIDPIKENTSILRNMIVMELDAGQSGDYKATAKQMKATAEQIAKLPEVEFVERVQKYQAFSSDAQYPYQWSLKNNGNDGVANADIQYEKLQNVMNGKSLKDTVIAVVDTGVDHTLADLNSRVQSEAGYNYIERSSNVKDDNGHGTHVSGIIAAAANNHYSMAGINPFAKILPVKVLDAAGSGDTEQIAHGIIYAADHGAKVINLSLGGSYSRVIEYALQYANKKNVTVVAASGNDGMEELSYPASSKYVVSVGGTNRLDLVSDYSNYGKGLDMVAPGTDIPSLVPDGNVTYMSGTSMAAPHVSAVAGLLLSQNPNLKPNEVEKLLTDTTKDIAFEEQDNPLPEEADVPIADVPIDDFPIKEEPVEPPVPGYDKVSGWGRLNAYGAASVLELNAKINPVLDIHSSVTGKAKSGSDVKVMSGNKVLGTGKANQSGDFSVKIPVQKTDQLLHVNVANQLAETTIRTVVEKAPEKPKVNRLTNNDTHVTGKVSPGLTVNVKDAAKKVIATAKADSTGSFKVKINKQKENTVLYVTTLDGYKESGEVKVTVIDVIAPGAPKVNTIGDKDIKITGKAEANAVVTAKVKGKVIGSAQANHKGDYQLKISKQKAGTVISVTAKDKAGNTSKEAKTTVKDKTAPSAPKVNAVYSKSTTVKGKTEANASVTVKAGNKTVGSGKANSKGGFSIKIKKQKANTKLSVTAKDKAGNTGSATKITVKKSK